MKKTVIALVLALPIAVCLVVAAWPQGFGLELAPVVAQVVAARVGVIGIAVVLLVLFLLLARAKSVRRFALTVVAMLAIFSLVSGGVHLSRGAGSSSAAVDGDITVLSWNTLGDEPGVDAVVRLIQETDADIVALPETRGSFAADVAVRMRELGKPFWAHTTYFSEQYGALSTSLLISAEFGPYTTDPEVGQTRTLPTIVARPDNGIGPVIVATHPVSPIPQQMRNWRSDLEFVAGLCDELDSVIMAGDFNSNLDHWANLGDGDIGRCNSALAAVGAGTTGTWPASLPGWLGTQIDHVVATPDWQPIDGYVVTGYDDAGSDHRPVVAVLRSSGS